MTALFHRMTDLTMESSLRQSSWSDWSPQQGSEEVIGEQEIRLNVFLPDEIGSLPSFHRSRAELGVD
jgi:hypothetical protein